MIIIFFHWYVDYFRRKDKKINKNTSGLVGI